MAPALRTASASASGSATASSRCSGAIDGVDQRRGLVQPAHDDHGAVGIPALAGDGGARKGFEPRTDRRLDGIGEGPVVGDQDRL